MSKRGCVLWWAIAGIMVAFVWARLALPLGTAGVLSMIVILCGCVVIVSVMLARAEKGVIEAGDNAERAGYADPIAPVTRTARAGCGTAFAWLAVLAVCGLLAAIVTGGT